MAHSVPNIPRRLLQLAWPVIGLNVLNVLALGVDTAMIGRTDQADAALTGLGFSTQIIFLLMVAMIGLTIGTIAFVSRAHGAGQRDRVDHILRQSTQLTILLGLVVAVVGNLVAPLLLRMLGASPEAMGSALDYLRPQLTFSVFGYLGILYAGMLRGVGNTRMAFVIALIMNACNGVFNYGLILGHYGLPALGVQGAALGTVLAQAVAAVIYIAWFRQGVMGLKLRLRPAPIDRALARDLARVGSPAALDMVILNAGFLVIIGLLGRIDQAAVAAHGIGLRIQALAFVPGMSISQATAAMVGNALGAGRVEEARSVARTSLLMSSAVMGSLGALFMWQAALLVTIFDVDPTSAVGLYSIQWIQILGMTLFPVGAYIALVGVFQGSGATRISLRINVVATLLVQIPLCWVLGFPAGLGAAGVWLGFPLSFVVKGLMGAWAYRTEAWARSGVRA